MNNKNKPRKDNRPPPELRILKRGDVREDGMVFIDYRPDRPNGEYWATKEILQKIRDRHRVYLQDIYKNKDKRPPKHLRTLTKGDVREDGMVFWGYASSCTNGEVWYPKDKYNKVMKRRSQTSKSWAKKNASRNNEYMRKRRQDPLQKMIDSQRTRLRKALNQIEKSDKTMNLIGCSAIELKEYLESKFTEGMTWENRGREGWHIDHIKPCASFDLSDPEQQRECFHYTNLQPLWAKDNLRKGYKII